MLSDERLKQLFYGGEYYEGMSTPDFIMKWLRDVAEAQENETRKDIGRWLNSFSYCYGDDF